MRQQRFVPDAVARCVRDYDGVGAETALQASNARNAVSARLPRRRRARSPVVVLLAVITLAAAAGLAAAARPSDKPTLRSPVSVNAWPQYRHDGRNSGYNAEERTLSRATVGRLSRAWTYDAGRGSGISSASVAVVHGTVYVHSDDGAVHAIRASNGRRLWRTVVSRARTWAAPAVAHGRIHVPTSESRMITLSRAGKPLWNVRLSSGSGGSTGSPVVAGSRLFIIRSAPSALEAASGKPVWVRDDLDCFGCTPAVAGGRVYLGADASFEAPPEADALYALDATTGETVWRTAVEGLTFAIASTAVLDANSVYIRALEAADTPKRQHVLLAFDRTSGALHWRAPLHRALPFHFAVPAVAGDTVVFQSTDDRLYALDTATGKRRWVVTPGLIGGSPTIANGVVYLTTGNGRLVALDLRNGRTLWSGQIGRKAERAGREEPPSAAVAGGTVYAATNRGTVVALKTRP